MSTTKTSQFSISYALSLTTCTAFALLAYLRFEQELGMGLAILFAVWAAIVSLLFVQFSFRIRTRSIWRSVLSCVLFGAGLIPIFYPSSILPDYDLRVKSRRNARLIEQQRERLNQFLADPETVLEASRQLQLKLLALPESQRRINGDSELLPPELARLDPVSIYASKNVLYVAAFRNYEKSFGFYAYPKGHRSKKVGTREIIDGLWWQEHAW